MIHAPLKILMLNYEFPPIGGGAALAHQAILHEFTRYPDLDIDVLTCAPQPGLFREQLAPHIRIHKIGIRKKDLHHWTRPEVLIWLYKARCYLKQLLPNNYDLAHAFFAFPTGWLCYTQRKLLPYILSLRGSDVPGHNDRLGLDYKLLAGLFRNIWSHAARIIAVSGGLRDEALRFMPNLRIDVIPNGIDAQQFHPLEKTTPAMREKTRLLFVGRLAGVKRMELILETLAILRRRGRPVEMNIVGQGCRLEHLKKMAAELHVSEHVRFHGRIPRDNMPEIYRQNDLFFIASRHEGMNNAMLEAMASGLPIVAAGFEGVEELIDDNGIIVPEPEPNPFAAAVEKLILNDSLRESMAAAARQKALNFSWAAVAEQYVKCYREIITIKQL